MANGARIRGKDVEDPRKDPRDVKKEREADRLVATSEYEAEGRGQSRKKREKERGKEGVEASLAEAGRAPGRHYLFTSSDCSRHLRASIRPLFFLFFSLSHVILSNILVYASNTIMYS